MLMTVYECKLIYEHSMIKRQYSVVYLLVI
jgi:hypothetical protein